MPTDAPVEEAHVARQLGLLERLPLRRIALGVISVFVAVLVVYLAYRTLTLPKGEAYSSGVWRDFLILGIAQGAIYA